MTAPQHPETAGGCCGKTGAARVGWFSQGAASTSYAVVRSGYVRMGWWVHPLGQRQVRLSRADTPATDICRSRRLGGWGRSPVVVAPPQLSILVVESRWGRRRVPTPRGRRAGTARPEAHSGRPRGRRPSTSPPGAGDAPPGRAAGIEAVDTDLHGDLRQRVVMLAVADEFVELLVVGTARATTGTRREPGPRARR